MTSDDPTSYTSSPSLNADITSDYAQLTRRSKKRRFSSVEDREYSYKIDDSDSVSSSFSSEYESSRKRKRVRVGYVPLTAILPPPLVFPKSLYRGHEPPMPQCSERIVLQDILVGSKSNSAYPILWLSLEAGSGEIYREPCSGRGRR